METNSRPTESELTKSEALVPPDRGLRTPFIAIALIIGFVQVWVNRFYMTLDGVSYLDMADAYLRHDWQTAINTYWNPLYSWFIGLAFLIFRPHGYWEYPVVHLVNFVIYGATVAAFEYFLGGLLKNRRDAAEIRIIAYGLFLWTSLEMIRVWMVNPDMIVAASVYLAIGILLRPIVKWSPIFLATTLAVGYYAKAVMIPIGCIVLLASCRVLTRRQWIVGVSTFALLCLPLIIALSRAAGYLTISDTGRLNYAWQANDVPRWYWLGGPDVAGRPIHPPRIVVDTPRVYEFGGVYNATYPIWYDASYWFRGLHIWWDLRGFVHNFARNSVGVAVLGLCQGGGFLVGWLVCFYRGKRKLSAKPFWHIWAVSLGAVLLFCAVHSEPRYLGPFFAITFLIPFVALQISEKWLAVSVTILGLVCAASFYRVTTVRGEKLRPWDNTPVNSYWQVAEGLSRMGLRPGDNVGLVCSGQGMQNSRWARLAKVHIVAEMFGDFNYWQLSEIDQQRVLSALASSRAKIAVTSVAPPDGAHAPGWVRVGSTTYYEHPLPSNAQLSIAEQLR